jgi:gliding motility-associated-like protein
VVIVVTDEVTVLVPNVFSPNGDNINETFVISVTGAKDVEGIIFNRWGQVMFSWIGPMAEWDGETPTGAGATNGTYFYLIKTISYTGMEQKFVGYLLLTW